jgi:tetratricopeptide (TPR) repeat protein
MKSIKPLLYIFALVGFLWACETTDPLVNDVQIFLLTGEYDQALGVVESALVEDDNNHIAHYYKGIILTTQSESFEDPRDRKAYYERARSSFDTAKRLMNQLEETPDELEDLEETVTYYWANEFNSGVNILNDDSVRAATPDPNFTAIAHFENAATVQPDSALSYQVMASAYFNENDIDNAVRSYEKAMELLQTPEMEDYEFMISILLVKPNYDRAIEYTAEARRVFPDETIFVQLLADAYLQAGDQDKAIELVEGLIAEDPDNPQYRRVLGTQIYQAVGALSNEVSDLYEEAFELRRNMRNLQGSERNRAEQKLTEIQSKIDSTEVEIDELTQITLRELSRVVELEPESESANFILGIIYQNRAASLFERRNNTEDNVEAQNLDARARANLQQALVYYEKAAEINPENLENWQSLFQVYTTLGMEEKAMEAMERAGLND